ncbi:MAG: hypothetical protein KatS3mg029_1041 [Saprospiraceae bacterium]|nr:MAG: hypothetical protein KatS3mg029_1041 [Saprospiraceae bacterium]
MEIITTQDGSPTIRLPELDVTYHSRYGAVQESRHVFIEHGLFLKSIGRRELDILEIGFGTGLNTLLTALESNRLGIKVHYTALDNRPLDKKIWSSLDYAATVGNPLTDSFFKSIHEAPWDKPTAISPAFTLEKREQRVEGWSPMRSYDLCYFDAFAPNSQPELWTEEIMSKMYQALKPGGVLVTYCAKSAFKRALKAAGFEVESLPGPPGKREMTRATRPAQK